MKRLQTLDIHFASDYPGNRLLEKRVITIPAEVEACEITHMTTDEGARNVRYSTYGNPTRIIMDKRSAHNLNFYTDMHRSTSNGKLIDIAKEKIFDTTNL